MHVTRTMRGPAPIISRAIRATAVERTALPVIPFATRTYATAADARPPVELYGVDGTYAKALYTAAAKTSTLDGTATALSKLHQTFKKDAKLQQIISTPTLSSGDKDGIIGELLKAASIDGKSKEGGTVKNFLETLAEHNRLSILDGACVKFEQLMGARRGEIDMTVTSAAQLDQKVLKQLEAAASKSKLAEGKKLKVVAKVQPDIRGGLIVEVGGRSIDVSVSSKIARMNKLLQDTL